MLAFVVLPLLFAFNLRAEDPAAGLDSAPFGFRCGMTGPQVIRLVGRTAVKKSPEGFLELATAAKPDSVFVSYSLVVSPKHGVVMINALGFNANASPDADLHHAFIDLRERLYGIYGAPDQNLDLIGNSSFAVFGGENAAADPGPRHWVAVWNLMPPPRQHIQGIVLDAEQASGFFFLSYQCAGIEGVSEKVKVSALSQSSVPTAFVPTSSPPAMAAPAVAGTSTSASASTPETGHQVLYKVTTTYIKVPVDITYRDAAGETQKVQAKAPWTFTFTGQPGQALSLSVSDPIDYGYIECAIYLDGVLLSWNKDWGVGTISAQGKVPPDRAN
jgi:hypothetical protein